MKDFRLALRVLTSLAVVSALLWLSGCARKPGGIEHVEIEKLDNGYLLRLRTEYPVGDVTAFVGPGNWLLITVADSTLDTTRIAQLRTSLVDSVEIGSFQTALQISLHMTIPIDRVEVVHQNPSKDVLISLFRKRRVGT